MDDRGELGNAALCCLLHSLVPGGSTWQWIRLLERHVALGGRATIFAEPGPLVEPAREMGIEVVLTSWSDPARAVPWATVGEHDVALVHWEQGVMDAFPRALEACGRAALSLHGTPQAMTRWFAPPTPAIARRTLERAVAEPHAVALVRGEAHRRKVTTAYAVPPTALRILPASVPVPSLPFSPARANPDEVLAMTRLAPEKAAIVRVAVELVRERLRERRPCRLRVAGGGSWRPDAIALCERRLPHDAWRIEDAPENPLARLIASDLVVAQGTTTLEAAALGRRVVVARGLGPLGASAVALTPDNYDDAARDPFGDPPVTEDFSRLWDQVLTLSGADLEELRQRVEKQNSLATGSRALNKALAATGTQSC
jgi:hypothetical protein